MTTPQLVWDIGTAYDFFVSLYTLHHPKDFAIRGAWAVGVRSRLPNAEREFLQEVTQFIHWPIDWVYDAVPAPKNGSAVLEALSDMPPAARLLALMPLDPEEEYDQVLQEIYNTGRWDSPQETKLHTLLSQHQQKRGEKYQKKDLAPMLNWWADAENFGHNYLKATQAYYELFFAEDELRLQSALHEALHQAQELAQHLSIPDLLEELSQGVHFEEPPQVEKLVLAPSFWGSPLLFYGRKMKERQLLLFGARPVSASIVPGDFVPDALFNGLKALADPTRLRILRYLIVEPLTPTELSRRLRLRAPTVVHHLRTLRLARLVNLTLTPDGQRYQARRETIGELYTTLNSFLDAPADDENG